MKMTYCGECANLLEKTGVHPTCPKCGAIFYNNPRPTACVFIVKDDKVLLGKRAVEPFKGMYHVTGGFLEPFELPEEGARREAREEAGVEVKIIALLGMYSDIYAYEEGESTLNIFYVGEIISGTPHGTDDLIDLEWFPILEMPALESFENVRQAAKALQEWYRRKTA